MNYKLYFYIIATMISAYSLSAVNFERLLKKNKGIEARILYFVLSFALGYLVAQLFLAFIPEGI